MSVDIHTEIVIERPADAVAAFAGDPTNAPRWYANIATVEWQTDPPARLGSRVAFVAHFLGRRLSYTYEIVELVEAHKLVMRTREGPFPMETIYEWHDIGDGRTRMVLRNRGQPTGFGRLTAPLLAAAMRRANIKDLAMLKQILESPAASEV